MVADLSSFTPDNVTHRQIGWQSSTIRVTLSDTDTLRAHSTGSDFADSRVRRCRATADELHRVVDRERGDGAEGDAAELEVADLPRVVGYADDEGDGGGELVDRLGKSTLLLTQM